MKRMIFFVLVVAVAGVLLAPTVVAATPPLPPQPSISTLSTSGSIALTWSDPTQCSDWYVSGDGSRWEFSCIWGAWEDDFWIEAYYWNEDDQLSHLLRYCGGSGYWSSFCCSVSPQGGACEA
jgi:hypothetical protein